MSRRQKVDVAVEDSEASGLLAEETGGRVEEPGEIIRIAVAEELEKIKREACYVPHANIYRCWAIGLCRGTRQRAMTICAILVQVLGPLMVVDYTRRMLMSNRQGVIWEHFEYLYSERLDMEKEYSFPEWLIRNPNARKQVEIKVLGGLLLALVFMSTDRQLLEQEMETNNLRRFFQLRSYGAWFWLWIDAICNGLAYMTIAVCLGIFLSYETSVPDLLLDAIGLYFMSNVDNIGLDVRYGIPIARYEELVSKAHALWARAHLKGELPKDKDQEHISACGPLPLMQKASVVVSFVRALNVILYCYEIPCFLLYIPTGEREQTLRGSEIHEDPIDLFVETYYVWLPWSLLILCCVGLSNLHHYCKLRRQQNREHSLEFFTSHFIFRRPDTEDESLESARAIVASDDQSQKIEKIEAELKRLTESSFGWKVGGATEGAPRANRQCYW